MPPKAKAKAKAAPGVHEERMAAIRASRVAAQKSLKQYRAALRQDCPVPKATYVASRFACVGVVPMYKDERSP